jgi:glycosyl transferase family 2
MIEGSLPTTADALTGAWRRAAAGDEAARGEWSRAEGGTWTWCADGLELRKDGAEWSAFEWTLGGPAALEALGNFVIEVVVSGSAQAAGLSFGPFKDFLTPVGAGRERHLQLEVDAGGGCWAFRVDGQIVPRQWWDAAVRSVDDLRRGVLSLKAHGAETVRFRALGVQGLEASCRLSVIITCHRFIQRLRVTLRNWCHQSLPTGTHEVLVVNPGSPDGTHEHMAAVASSYPHVRVRELLVDGALATNKGVMINRALAASRGEWIWLTDADCLFGPGSAARVLDYVATRPPRVFFGQRRHLTAAQTAGLLAGRLDGGSDFDALAEGASLREPDNAPWGYTQIVRRQVTQTIRYRETFNHFARSDEVFIDDCRHRRIAPEQVPGLFCLHLDHPFAWHGTNDFL